MANKYLLHGNGIQVEYVVGANPSFAALTFTEGATNKSFTPAQINTDQTGLGTLLSVPLVQTIDAGGTRFGLFLPEVQTALGQKVPVSTIGMFEMFSGPDSVPHRATTWQSVHLHGVAEEIIIPLAALPGDPVSTPVSLPTIPGRKI
jgi:hypothetical protein